MTALKARHPDEVKPGHIHGAMFGKPGAGKTWFALSFPTPYYIDCEGGASLGHYMRRLKESGGAYYGVEDGSSDFSSLIGQIQALATEKHKYRTLVIDSVTKIYQLAIAKEQERLGEGKDVFGASKKPAIANMRRILMWISRLDMNVWFVAHQTAEWGMVDGERKEIGVEADIWGKIAYELHLVLHVQHPNRNLRTATVTKSRLVGFPEFDRFTLQDGERDVGYEEFAKRYGRDYIEAESVPIVLAMPAQLEMINRLTGIIKLSEAEIEKVLSRANAESYAELSSEQATKFIGWLKAKIDPKVRITGE